MRRLDETDQLQGGVFAALGDYLIEGDQIRILVGGMERPPEMRGAIIDFSYRGMPIEDGITSYRSGLSLGSDWYPMDVRAIRVVELRNRPALRVEGRVRISRREIAFVEDYVLARVPTALSIFSKLSTEDEFEGVRVGGEIAWGGPAPFVPGIGELSDQVWHDADWLGREGTHAATVFAFRESGVRLRAHYEQHGRELFMTRTEVLSPQIDLHAGETRTVRSSLIVAAGGLSEAVRHLGWTRGRPFREVRVESPYTPPGMLVMAYDPEGHPLVRGRPEANEPLKLPLPAVADTPRARIVAVAYGHAPSESVSIDESTEAVIVLLPEGGRIWVRASNLEGEAVPARIRVLGIEPTLTPNLGPSSRADGAFDTVVSASGDAVIPVPPGRYRVLVTRGPEWSIFDHDVVVTDTFQPRVDAYLEHEVDASDWVASDLHVHASPSGDSEVTLRDRLATLIAEGIRFAVPTDHNHVTDYERVRDEAHVRDLGSVPGVEVTTWAPDFGHFNAYPVPYREDLPMGGAPAFEGLTPESLFANLRMLDPEVVIQVNHPRLEPNIGYFDRMALDPETGIADDNYRGEFDLLEVWNGYDLDRMPRLDRVFREWLTLLRRGHRYVAVGNSDSHHVHYRWAGYPRTYVYAPNADPVAAPREIVRALRAGRAFVTSGPFLEASILGAGPGETAEVAPGEVQVRVRVQAPSWMDVDTIDIYVDGELYSQTSIAIPDAHPAGPTELIRRGQPPEPARLPVLRFEDEIPISIAYPGFVIVRVSGDRHMGDLLARAVLPVAFTNPIWMTIAAPSAQVH